MSKVVAKLIRYGECIRCGECCRQEEFKIPEFWENGKCKYLEGDKCIIDAREIDSSACSSFPTGRESFILKQLARRKRADFRSLLPRCPFEFELVYE